MTEVTKNKAISLVRNNFNFLDDVVKFAIINLLEDADIECEKDFLAELQNIHYTRLLENKDEKETQI